MVHTVDFILTCEGCLTGNIGVAGGGKAWQNKIFKTSHCARFSIASVCFLLALVGFSHIFLFVFQPFLPESSTEFGTSQSSLAE